MSAALSGSEMRAIAKEAFIYGWPVCENYNTLYAYSIDVEHPEYKAPFNQIHSTARVFTPEDKAIITPNSDTPYSFAWLDLRAEPVVITVPAMEKDRYFSFQMIDMYTHNFDYLGTRCTGNSGGVYMITGPGWKGGSYSGEGPPAKALAIQAGYEVTPLSSYLGKPTPEAKSVNWPKSDKALTMTVKMYEILDFVLSLLPVHESERELRARLLKLGIGSGGLRVSESPPEIVEALELGMKDGWAEYEDVIEKSFAQGKMSSADLFGTRDFLKNEYIKRLYKTLDGQALDASKSSYKLVLSKKDQEIPKAFWSLTMYDGVSQLLVENPLNRYLLNSAMLPSMKVAEDGSVTLHISASSPGPDLDPET
ncbi:hypothetical protein AK812_SmicGene16402 [Symbiodinium microadriaticum]|uniref:DUF1254 domain-containing protein n=1 Tax=Symbiodinium microadriaticum TaxID=2951 RepID=A0A1Q9E0F2_SYMMI|nr:hypothetical protein AK812_SmicGene16402 [Symbiodinium microadriaticum]